MNKYLLYLIGFLLVGCFGMYKILKDTQEKLSVASINNKAHLATISDISTANRAYEMSVQTLRNYNDSVSIALQESLYNLDIKESEVQNLQYILSTTAVRDSIIIQYRDRPIFIEPSFHIDTTIKSKWYSVGLEMSYPNTVIIEPSFKNELITIVHSTKETIEEPKKFFLARLFQRKHTVVIVEVSDNNPYTSIEAQRYIKTFE